jgi:cyclophilin family peptidyl-prolyl cis-trans isomerase
MKQYIIYTLGILFVIGLGFYAYINNKVNTEEVNLNQNNLLENQITNEDTKTLDENSKSDSPKENINIKENKKMTKAIFKTNKGSFEIEFLADQAPKTVENFIKLASEGFYDGTKFHRIIEGFMNQGGDPLTKDDSMSARWGTGGPGYKFDDEITPNNKNIVGTISMANAGPNTNGSQFFINVANNNFLDTKHTVFGKVVAGLEVVLDMNKVATDANDRPLDPVIIESIVLE